MNDLMLGRLWQLAAGLALVALLLLFVFVRWLCVGVTLQRDLDRWGLPRDLPERAASLHTLELSPAVDRLDWLPEGPRVLDISGTAVRHLELPKSVRCLDASNSSLKSGVDRTTLSSLRYLALAPLHTELPTLAKALPDDLHTLIIENRTFRGLERYPAGLKRLVIEVEEKESLDLRGLPAGLRSLELTGGDSKTLPFLPPRLEHLALDATLLASVEPIPARLRSLHLTNNADLVVQGLPELLSVLRVVDVGAEHIACESLPKTLHSLQVEASPWPCPPESSPGVALPNLVELDVEPGDISKLRLRQDGGDHGSLAQVTLYMPSSAQVRMLPSSVIDLTLIRYPPKDLTVLARFPNLQRLVLVGCSLTSLRDLPKTLRSLEIRACRFDTGDPDIPPAVAANLIELVYPWSSWSKLPAGYDRLRRLNLNSSKLESLDNLPPSLVELSIAGTNVTELPSSFHELDRLRKLVIVETGVSDLSLVPDRLTELVLGSGEGVRDLEPLPTGLRRLRFTESGGYSTPGRADSLRRLTELDRIRTLDGTLSLGFTMDRGLLDCYEPYEFE